MLRIVFLEPRIAGNTGNAIRMVAGTGAELHLVEPLGFDMSEPRLRRAGLDYHDLAHVSVHPDLTTAFARLGAGAGADAGAGAGAAGTVGARVLAFTTQARTWHTDVAHRPDDVLLFGPEPTGLPPEVLARPEVTEQVRIPMLPGRRSMNLANAAAVATYEAWRQLGFPGAV